MTDTEGNRPLMERSAFLSIILFLNQGLSPRPRPGWCGVCAHKPDLRGADAPLAGFYLFSPLLLVWQALIYRLAARLCAPNEALVHLPFRSSCIRSLTLRPIPRDQEASPGRRAFWPLGPSGLLG